jgi:N-acetyl sugar amidotransferase
MLQYCNKCLVPVTRPEQVFTDGTCDACISTAQKKIIDWDARKAEFELILNKYRGDGYKHDCIIPVSGGKDSCYQAVTMREKYGMNPLCVNFVPCEMTEVGHKNLEFLRDQGFDLIQVGPNRKSYKQLSKIGFEKLGDSCWPEHIGMFTLPITIAVKFKIPLIIWGENSQIEYGGPASRKTANYLDRSWLEQFMMLGYRLSDTIYDGVNPKDIYMMEYPEDQEIHEIGVTGLFLGYYEAWDTKRNLDLMESRGWHRNPNGPVEGAYNDFENLDCKWIGGLHDYMKFLKFGYGRATDQLNIEIRAGRLSRKAAIAELHNSSEGKLPRLYLDDYLKFINISEQECFKILDRFTNKNLFELNSDGTIKKDANGDVIRKYWPT